MTDIAARILDELAAQIGPGIQSLDFQPTLTLDKATLNLRPGECWWGGMINSGYRMPFPAGAEVDLADMRGNCAMPLLISNRGRYIWSEEPFRFSLTEEQLHVVSHVEGATLLCGDGFETLRNVYRHVSQTFFPPGGKIPAPLLFTAPQYNTWMDMTYYSTQERVLEYAQGILEHGFPPGVLMIDTLWHPTYGTWQFDQARYPDARAMVRQLNEMGFKVMVWMVPYITADTLTFRELWWDRDLLIMDGDKPALIWWWDGFSAALDLTKPAAVAWLHEQMDRLIEKVGISGFKLDGGQPSNYAHAGVANPHAHTLAWNRVGLRYEYVEYKDSWKCAGWPLAQRIRDRAHSWDADEGLNSLIPMGLEQGLMGYTFTCPDMIGGGEYGELDKVGSQFDPELFVRYAQVAALFPMMQFSLAPWKLLDDRHLAVCREMAHLHVQLGPEILALAHESARTGEPLMRHLAYSYPDGGYEHVNDQFLLGEDILVAPVTQKGAVTRTVHLPPGLWRGDDGSLVEGPCAVEVSAPLERLPWYRRQARP